MRSFSSIKTALQMRWDAMVAREKTGLVLAIGVIVMAILWWWLLAPALTVLRGTDVQHRVLDAQLQAMKNMQTQAQSLQSRPKVSFEEASRQLTALVKKNLGQQAQVSITAERATVTLKAASPDSVTAWLAQARVDARALPVEMRLTRATSTAANTSSPSGWDGVIVLTLPTR